MKRYFQIGVFIIVALIVGFSGRPLNADQEPLQSLADTICAEGYPFPTSKLFELFELEIPFLISTDGAEMMAAPAQQCQNFHPASYEAFFMVLGHRSAKGTATFFVTSPRGELIQAARGAVVSTGDLNFVNAEPTSEMKAEFEAAKTFWLRWSSSPL